MVGKYTVTEQIGKGATSVVYEGTNNKTREKVAIKVIDSRNTRNLHLAANEIRVLQRLDHPNIIKILETVETETQTLIVLEKCKFSLSSVAKSGALPYKTVLRIFRDILVGMRYLHTNGVIHRDIKLGNVMISESNDLKIIDFGLSKDTLFSTPKTFCGTPDFISPEMMGRMPYTKKTDIYSAGMLVYFLIFRCDYSKSRMESGKRSEQYGALVSLLEKMLEKDPSKRISAEEALTNPIFSSFFPQLIPIEGIKSFQITTKLGRIEYSDEKVAMTAKNVSFAIRSGMGGVYQMDKRTAQEVYIPFSATDTKTLKLVGFCYSILGLVKKRTPVVIILTDKGKFFKMLKDTVYVYIVDEFYILWQNGEMSAKNLKSKERVQATGVSKEEMESLIYESIRALRDESTQKRPITIDKRTFKKGSLQHSTYPSMGLSLESATLASLAPGSLLKEKSEYCPIFIRQGVILRLEPYLYFLFLFSGGCFILNLHTEVLVSFSDGLPKQVHQISSSTDREMLQNILLFGAVLSRSSRRV
ncbi:hormonally upregulated Neu-associated kinase [Nematocida minor]|uniref:hormonally upregulated Neu-associated kinase n=1 Tax=Nematocida minor TaxID=1912983 RepID=UPI00221E54C9|nr:hormonally upregulated Neu-associated kinase [Nematocida minor]KAI5190849.1 hormonally upregulated Neu-associated kinase [Nematocida minor]